jgi:hypothetical protein
MTDTVTPPPDPGHLRERDGPLRCGEAAAGWVIGMAELPERVFEVGRGTKGEEQIRPQGGSIDDPPYRTRAGMVSVLMRHAIWS